MDVVRVMIMIGNYKQRYTKQRLACSNEAMVIIYNTKFNTMHNT